MFIFVNRKYNLRVVKFCVKLKMTDDKISRSWMIKVILFLEVDRQRAVGLLIRFSTEGEVSYQA